MTPDTLPPPNRDQDDSRGLITLCPGLLRRKDIAMAQRQNGSTLQVLQRTGSFLFHGQTCTERATLLGLLRHLKARSLTDSQAERLKLRGARN